MDSRLLHPAQSLRTLLLLVRTLFVCGDERWVLKWSPWAPRTSLALGVFLWRVFSRMYDQIEVRFDKVDQRFDKVDERFYGVDERFDKVDERFDRVEGRIDGVERRVDAVEGRMGTLEGRIGSLEDKVDWLAADHQSLARELSEFRGEMRGRLAAVLPGTTEV